MPLRDPLERLGERVADRIAALGELALQLGVADAERPELVEEQRPLRVALQEGTKLLGRVLAGLGALRGIRDRADLGHTFLDLTIGESQEQLLLTGEVRVEGANREPRLGGDLVDCRPVVATPGEHLRRCRKQTLARPRLGLFARHHGRHDSDIVGYPDCVHHLSDQGAAPCRLPPPPTRPRPPASLSRRSAPAGTWTGSPAFTTRTSSTTSTGSPTAATKGSAARSLSTWSCSRTCASRSTTRSARGTKSPPAGRSAARIGAGRSSCAAS